MKSIKGKVICVDCDGTLTKDVCWTREQMTEAKPRQEIIDIVNEWGKSNFIVIHTARRHECYLETYNWLQKHGVRFHAISMGKCPADFYLDDLTTRPEELLPIEYELPRVPMSKKKGDGGAYDIEGMGDAAKELNEMEKK